MRRAAGGLRGQDINDQCSVIKFGAMDTIN
jgi:hypothetical protein